MNEINSRKQTKEALFGNKSGIIEVRSYFGHGNHRRIVSPKMIAVKNLIDTFESNFFSLISYTFGIRMCLSRSEWEFLELSAGKSKL